jgi:L-fucose isomerase-like protein
VKPGPATYFRVSTDDTAGCVRTYVGEAEFTADPFGMDGGIAVTRVPRMRELLGHLCRNGFEHHVAMVRGQHAAAVEEAVSRYLGWETYHHR